LRGFVLGVLDGLAGFAARRPYPLGQLGLAGGLEHVAQKVGGGGERQIVFLHGLLLVDKSLVRVALVVRDRLERLTEIPQPVGDGASIISSQNLGHDLVAN
jgi:hypothetical protein